MQEKGKRTERACVLCVIFVLGVVNMYTWIGMGYVYPVLPSLSTSQFGTVFMAKVNKTFVQKTIKHVLSLVLIHMARL